VPRIHFGVETGELLGAMAEAGADVVGVDWRTPLDEARRRLPAGVGVQGNLDPVACLCPWEVVRTKAAEVVASNDGRPGHIFNLGHGVLPETDPAILTRLVEALHGGEL
jgi:uroporphyrinogen decarboxylase